MKKEENLTQNYRGVFPAEVILVLEGDGTDKNPYIEVQYVARYSNVAGLGRLNTIGKIIPLTEEERKWFGN